MDRVDVFTIVENRLDRITYQSDLFFWSLILLDIGIYIVMWKSWIPLGSGGGIATVLLIFAISWLYTNARRRGCAVIKSGFFSLLSLIHPLVGAILYFIFRPKNLVVTFLPPSPSAVLPVFSGPVWIFMRAPFRFIIKLALWSMGGAFLIIGLLELIKEVQK